MSPARTRTRTTQSGVKRTNHEDTAPPTRFCYWINIIFHLTCFLPKNDTCAFNSVQNQTILCINGGGFRGERDKWCVDMVSSTPFHSLLPFSGVVLMKLNVYYTVMISFGQNHWANSKYPIIDQQQGHLFTWSSLPRCAVIFRWLFSAKLS